MKTFVLVLISAWVGGWADTPGLPGLEYFFAQSKDPASLERAVVNLMESSGPVDYVAMGEKLLEIIDSIMWKPLESAWNDAVKEVQTVVTGDASLCDSNFLAAKEVVKGHNEKYGQMSALFSECKGEQYKAYEKEKESRGVLVTKNETLRIAAAAKTDTIRAVKKLYHTCVDNTTSPPTFKSHEAYAPFVGHMVSHTQTYLETFIRQMKAHEVASVEQKKAYDVWSEDNDVYLQLTNSCDTIQVTLEKSACSSYLLTDVSNAEYVACMDRASTLYEEVVAKSSETKSSLGEEYLTFERIRCLIIVFVQTRGNKTFMENETCVGGLVTKKDTVFSLAGYADITFPDKVSLLENEVLLPCFSDFTSTFFASVQPEIMRPCAQCGWVLQNYGSSSSAFTSTVSKEGPAGYIGLGATCKGDGENGVSVLKPVENEGIIDWKCLLQTPTEQGTIGLAFVLNSDSLTPSVAMTESPGEVLASCKPDETLLSGGCDSLTNKRMVFDFRPTRDAEGAPAFKCRAYGQNDAKAFAVCAPPGQVHTMTVTAVGSSTGAEASCIKGKPIGFGCHWDAMKSAFPKGESYFVSGGELTETGVVCHGQGKVSFKMVATVICATVRSPPLPPKVGR